MMKNNSDGHGDGWQWSWEWDRKLGASFAYKANTGRLTNNGSLQCGREFVKRMHCVCFPAKSSCYLLGELGSCANEAPLTVKSGELTEADEQALICISKYRELVNYQNDLYV